MTHISYIDNDLMQYVSLNDQEGGSGGEYNGGQHAKGGMKPWWATKSQKGQKVCGTNENRILTFFN